MCNTRAFRDLDRNHDGRISRQELHDACERWNLPTTAVDKVLGHVSIDGTPMFSSSMLRWY